MRIDLGRPMTLEEIAYAKELGIDFIICDHHVPDEELPCAVAILNPKREDNRYPYTDLSGCGVGFKFMQAFAQSNGIEFNQLHSLLDLCVISIASDIVPIMGENRILAYHGLRILNSKPSVGLKAVCEVCGVGDREVTMNDIIFKIGPRLNASGRMQNGKEAVQLLVERNYPEALELANLIDQYNDARKDLDKQMTEEAIEMAKATPGIDDHRSVVIYNEAWHKGVIGIVASRLTELYYRPAVVLTRSEGIATGSARSVTGFDVYKAIENCRDLLENFGGHTYAAGLSMKIENMTVQHTELSKRIACSPNQNTGAFSVVAVAGDTKVQGLLLEMGADVVICADENVSTKDYLDAFDHCNTEYILVFPNSSDAILSAMQAKKLYKKAKVKVLPSRSVAACYAALPTVDFDRTDVPGVTDSILEVINNLYVVSVAKRNSTLHYKDRDIRRNEFYSFSGKELIAVSKSLEDTALQTIRKVLQRQEREIITVFYRPAVEKTVHATIEAARQQGILAEFFQVAVESLPGLMTISFE